MNKVRCIRVEVYRSEVIGDCTFHGISGRFRTLLVACPDGPYSFDADVETPINFCFVEARQCFGDEIVYDLKPAMVTEDGRIKTRGGRWYMMGGNFAYTSDSRFRSLTPGMYGAVAVHDRWEGRRVS